MELLNSNIISIFDKLYEGIYYVNKERKIKYWSKHAEKLTVYKAEEVIDRRLLGEFGGMLWMLKLICLITS